jgi:hypothetical protein
VKVMAIPIKFTPKYSGMSAIGKRIFDLSINALIAKRFAAAKFIHQIQEKAKDSVPNVHILPSGQIHITFINPIFKMEGKHSIPGQREQEELFEKFTDILKTNRRAQQILGATYFIQFGGIFVREKDVRIVVDEAASHDKVVSAQEELGQILLAEDECFDLGEGTPVLHSTILRFGPEFNQSDYNQLSKILQGSAEEYSPEQLAIKITINEMRAVQFNGLFVPWEKETILV